MVIFNASFDDNGVPDSVSMASGLLINGGGGGGLSPVAFADTFGGDTDDDVTTKRIPLAVIRAACDDGDIVRFCGDANGGKFVAAVDVGIETGGGGK